MPARGHEAPRRVAAFDLDGTLTRRDCVTPFLRRAGGSRLWRTLVWNAPAVATSLARRDRDRLKEIAAGALRGLAEDEIDRLGRAFAEQVAASWLRDDTHSRLAWHRSQGDTTLIVSASFEAYVRPLGALLGVDDVLCTRLEADAGGVLTGRLDGENCRGLEKAVRLEAWLRDRGLAGTELWAYGDSAGDEEMLAMAARPIRVRGVKLTADPVSVRS